MKRSLWSMFTVSMALMIILASCSASPSAPSSIPLASTLVPQKVASSALAGKVVAASAIVAPKQRANLSFVIAAPVKEILVKKDDVVKAGQPLIVLSTPGQELAVQGAEWAVSAAQSLYDRSRDPYKKIFYDGRVLYAAGYVEKRTEMEAKLQSAQASLDSEKYALAQGMLLAPFDGMIVDVNIKTGEIAQPGKVAVIVGDITHMQIETTDLSERDIASVKIGQTANVHVKALDTTITGKVLHISPISETVGGDVTYPVTIELDEQPEGLLWGMSADVEIQTK